MAKHGGLVTFAQSLLEYVEDLITASPKDSFSKIDILVLLNAVKHDPDLRTLLESCDIGVRPPTYNE
jgi:hypothetical protein